MLVSRAVGFGVAFASAFSLVPLVVMYYPFLLVYGCVALLCRVFCVIGSMCCVLFRILSCVFIGVLLSVLLVVLLLVQYVMCCLLTRQS